MRQTAVHILISLTLLASAGQTARAWAGDNRAYGFLMMEEPVNPRNIGMGSAGAALGGSGFRYYNPAAPFFNRASYVSAEFGQMPGGVNKGGFESALVFPEWYSAVSFHSSSVDFETRDERGEGYKVSSAATFGAITAGIIRGNVSLAASLTMAEDRIWMDDAYSAAAFSFGLGYKMMDDNLNLGASMSHHAAWSKGLGGNTSNWSDEGLVPTYARVGAAWSSAFRSLPYTVAADIVYHDEDGRITVPLGIDVKVLPYLNLRAGKRVNWDDEVMSIGIGLKIDRIAFDAAFVPTVFVDDYEMKWSMSFTYVPGARAARRVETPPASETPRVEEAEPEIVVEVIDTVIADTAVVDATIIDTAVTDTVVVDTTTIDNADTDTAAVDTTVIDKTGAEVVDVDAAEPPKTEESSEDLIEGSTQAEPESEPEPTENPAAVDESTQTDKSSEEPAVESTEP